MKLPFFILSTLFTFFSFCSAGQELKKVKEEHSNPAFTEEFYVLKAEKTIKHGPYKKRGYKNHLIEEGFYKNNSKDSTWTEYHWRSDVKEAEGIYTNNKKSGVWNFYDRKGELHQQYNFTTNELVYFKPSEKEKLFEVKTPQGIISTSLDRPALYIGGDQKAVESFLKNKLKYPTEAINKGIEGTVWISFFIDPHGFAIDYYIEKSIGGGCDEEALRVVKMIENNWIPALKNGQPVTAKSTMPVKFVYQ